MLKFGPIAIFSNLAIACWLSVCSVRAAEVLYQLSDAILTNPERGLYQQLTAHAEGKALDAKRLRRLREQGLTLLLRMYYLDKFRAADLSDTQLQLIEEDFRAIRQAGCKCILRFAYSSNIGKPDAPLKIVLRHIEQLEPLWRDNADVIAVLQAGFIGAWGEWHGSTNNLETDEAVRAIAERLLKSLPVSRSVQIRTPTFKRTIVGHDQPLDIASAFTGTPQARLGHHNDCFLADDTDLGTYDPARLSWDKNYVATDTRYVPMGGETCSPSSFTESKSARAQLQRMHWSYLNQEFHPAVIKAWEQSGLLDEAKKHLGYRLALLTSSCDSRVAAGATWNITLKIQNLGWAAPFNPRDVKLVLKSPESSDEFQVTVPTDPREWLPGEPQLLRFAIGIPKNMPPGKFELFLRLPDPKPRLQHRTEYAIQLVNVGLWNPQTAAHDLKQTVTVDQELAVEPYTGEIWFKLAQ
ncbi:MAG: DUF4832 domain-containing protein [Bythopirellula sp.]|nr:DUF4832 domain-containing protein [Bythopirellula sp.]